MRFIAKFIFACLVFIACFSLGYFGAQVFIYELRIQECLIVESKLQQFVYLQKDLKHPKQAKRQKVYYPKTLDEVGPVYWNFFGIHYEIQKDKFDYEPALNRQQYSLEVSLPYGKKYVSPRSHLP